ncbi:MAG: hypothetical protein WBA41_01255 [Rivularia sp. (in: cyanobacteria)]
MKLEFTTILMFFNPSCIQAPNLTQEEIEAMFDLGEDIKNTGYYQSILKKTKLQVVPSLIEKGLSIQEIAEMFELDVEEVRKVARGELQ